MDKLDVKKALMDAWQTLGVELAPKRRGHSSLQPVVDAERVFHALADTPWMPAQELARELGFGRDRLLLAYKCMQGAKGLSGRFKESIHSDYYNVIRHYFNTPFYTLVFFVGTTCPSRCVFCPNVTVHSDGHRTLTGYGRGMPLMDESTIDTMFRELERLKIDGTGLLVKISGGLEPMTDVETLTHIARRAKDLGVPVKLFTNGILLNTDKRRRAALMVGDIRVSLSTSVADQYETINFGRRTPRPRMRFDHLKENLRNLVQMRDRSGSGTKIGFNSIIMPDNTEQVIPLMEMARDLGLDYIDFKPDYFGTVSEAEQATIMTTVKRAMALSKDARWKGLYVHFAGSMWREHLYWRSWSGVCDAVKQVGYKIFVTPFGHLCPIHYGAFPHGHTHPEEELTRWSVGRLGADAHFMDVLAHPHPIPDVPWSHLNPFELMLSLEIERESRDRTWGIPVTCSPYHTRYRHEMPSELVDAWRRQSGHAL